MRTASQPIPQSDAANRQPLRGASKHERTPARPPEKRIDETLEDTFPASDPPATGGVTRIDPEPHPPSHRPPDRGEPGTP
ncbi:hypothetical protein [Burkholderia plantarii]|uniref:hypothetical protein n=1 Tax=Burkholderia plantarii TaxID=41899 RepID=UPI0005AF1BA4|nr:hypothetical protein [Burkholderia plantarii]